MLISPEEALLLLGQWCERKSPVFALHFTHDMLNHSFTPCVVSGISNKLELSDGKGLQGFTASFDLATATWLYLELHEIPDLPDSIHDAIEKERPIVALAWPGSELLILFPL